nr:Chain C, Topoisomerase I-Derived Peptide [synthetic construct]1RFF_E Chain E, Topoisomerase I-Derived Peptide [synthetic construct]
KLNYYDPR